MKVSGLLNAGLCMYAEQKVYFCRESCAEFTTY
jgi:hypothetical protein